MTTDSDAEKKRKEKEEQDKRSREILRKALQKRREESDGHQPTKDGKKK